MNEKLNLKGENITLQEWIKSANISNVKYSSNKYIKSNRTKIKRSFKLYSLV